MTSRARVPIVGGNWKMNTTLQDAEVLAQAIVEAIGHTEDVEVLICPPFTNLHSVGRVIARSHIRLGAQDVFYEEKGAYTGEISAEMLSSVGASWVICGHSERRRTMGESSQIVNRKARRALASGLRVILAVGETHEERQTAHTERVLEEQLGSSLFEIGIGDMERVVIAYEPVWAIGTGLTATPVQAEQAHAFVRGRLERRFGPDVAAATRIQYGGSVTPTNAPDLMAQPDIDGALVGGASLNAGDFARIVQAAGARL